jgi:hypothetical protein
MLYKGRAIDMLGKEKRWQVVKDTAFILLEMVVLSIGLAAVAVMFWVL